MEQTTVRDYRTASRQLTGVIVCGRPHVIEVGKGLILPSVDKADEGYIALARNSDASMSESAFTGLIASYARPPHRHAPSRRFPITPLSGLPQLKKLDSCK